MTPFVQDAPLVAAAQLGDLNAAEQLLRRHGDLALKIARHYYLPGGERDDVDQEALFGLLRAIRDYDPTLGDSFTAFATLCVRRWLATCLATATRLKHRSLNESARVVENDEGEIVSIVEFLAAREPDPVTQISRRAELARLGRDVRVLLSPMEANCLLAFANGFSYEQIAARFGYASGRDGLKAVDRAITRARWKLAGQGPPSAPDAGLAKERRQAKVYCCPSCGGPTIKAIAGRGRPPRCNVCVFRAAA